jgi:hypothetical protein
MAGLDARGWYRELAKRRRREYLKINLLKNRTSRRISDKINPSFLKNRSSRSITDPEEMDRIMCRSDVVAVCNTQDDLEVASFNNRLVLEIDPDCPDEILFKKIAAELKRARTGKVRRINVKTWAKHRILMLYDLKLMGHEVSKNRKQLAMWMFPEIKNEKRRGDKFDRATEYLAAALHSLNTLRAQTA